MKDMLTGRGRPHPKVSGPGHPPPHLSKAAEAWSQGPAFPALGEGPALAPRPAFFCQHGISMCLASTSVVGEGRPVQAAGWGSGGRGCTGGLPSPESPPVRVRSPPGRGERRAGLSAPWTGLGSRADTPEPHGLRPSGQWAAEASHPSPGYGQCPPSWSVLQLPGSLPAGSSRLSGLSPCPPPLRSPPGLPKRTPSPPRLLIHCAADFPGAHSGTVTPGGAPRWPVLSHVPEPGMGAARRE